MLSHLIAPYTFPLLIEFCVSGTTQLIYVWEKCGSDTGTHEHNDAHHTDSNTHEHPISDDLYDQSVIIFNKKLSTHAQKKINAIIDRQLTPLVLNTEEQVGCDVGSDNDGFESDEHVTKTSGSRATNSTESQEVEHVRPIYLITQKDKKLYYNNHFGFLFSWLLMSGVVVTILIYYYMIYSEIGYTSGLETCVYVTQTVLCTVCIALIPYTAYRMAELQLKSKKLIDARRKYDVNKSDSKSHSKYNVDSALLYQTFLAVLIFQIMIMISALEQDKILIFVASLSQLLFACLQTLFLNLYASKKRSTKPKHLHLKPGRQGVEVLRVTNFSLWLVNTFLLENIEMKRMHYYSYGHDGWTVLSNIFQPLTILYHFHAMVYYAEIIQHNYTSKYIGLPIEEDTIERRNND